MAQYEGGDNKVDGDETYSVDVVFIAVEDIVVDIGLGRLFGKV